MLQPIDPKLLEEILSLTQSQSQTDLAMDHGGSGSGSGGSGSGSGSGGSGTNGICDGDDGDTNGSDGGSGDGGSGSGSGSGSNGRKGNGSVVRMPSPDLLSSSSSTLGSRLGTHNNTQSNPTLSNHHQFDPEGAADVAGVGTVHSVRDRWHEMAETSPEPMSPSSQSNAPSSQSNSQSSQSNAPSSDAQLLHSESSFSLLPSTKPKTRIPSPQSNSQSNLRAPQSLSHHDLEVSPSHHHDMTEGDSQCDVVLLSSIHHDTTYDGNTYPLSP